VQLGLVTIVVRDDEGAIGFFTGVLDADEPATAPA